MEVHPFGGKLSAFKLTIALTKAFCQCLCDGRYLSLYHVHEGYCFAVSFLVYTDGNCFIGVSPWL